MGAGEEKDFLTLNGTILSYTGSDESLTVPRRLKNSLIRELGMGAFSESQKLARVEIPAQITRVGEFCFSDCSALEQVELETLPEIKTGAFHRCGRLREILVRRFPVSPGEYETMLSNSLELPGGMRVLQRCRDYPAVKALTDAVGVHPAAQIPEGIDRLFSLSEEEIAAPLSKQEREAFAGLIRDRREAVRSPGTESENDALVRKDTVPKPRKTAVLCFDEKTKVSAPDWLRVQVRLLIGFHYVQGMVPVVWEGKRWYLCQRLFLSNQEQLQYLRQDCGIFTEEGKLADGRTSGMVLAKYKLLSIL